MSLFSLQSYGALLSRASGQAYYDDVLNITWLADANTAARNAFGVTFYPDSSMSWDTANEWIAAMNTANYFGVNNWRLPTTLLPDPSCTWSESTGFGCTGSEMGHLFNVDGVSTSTPSPFTNVRPFTNGQPSYYWSATVPPGSPGTAFLFSFSDGIQFNEEFFFPQYTWAVSPGDLLPLDDAVPIPAAVWLFGSALGVLGWMKRKGNS